jgi:hypothetical protein
MHQVFHAAVGTPQDAVRVEGRGDLVEVPAFEPGTEEADQDLSVLVSDLLGGEIHTDRLLQSGDLPFP